MFFFTYCLLANVIGKVKTIPRHPYVRLTSKSNDKETSLSYHFLRNSNHLKLHEVCIKREVMISGKHLVTLWRLLQ